MWLIINKEGQCRYSSSAWEELVVHMRQSPTEMGGGGGDRSESRTAYSILKVAARAGVGRAAPEGASGKGEQADGPCASSTANLSAR